MVDKDKKPVDKETSSKGGEADLKKKAEELEEEED